MANELTDCDEDVAFAATLRRRANDQRGEVAALVELFASLDRPVGEVEPDS